MHTDITDINNVRNFPVSMRTEYGKHYAFYNIKQKQKKRVHRMGMTGKKRDGNEMSKKIIYLTFSFMADEIFILVNKCINENRKENTNRTS